MATQTKNLNLTKPEGNDYVEVGVLSDNFEIIDKVVGELAGRKVEIPPDFDNLLAWPGCKRITPPKDETANTYTETIVNSTTNALRAKRVTVQNGESDYTETYTFYEADGVTQKARYVVQTTKDGTETWTEDVTKEAVE